MLVRKKKSKLKLIRLMPGLLKSITTKNKMFKALHELNDNLALTEKNKAYGNALNWLMRLAKRNYHHSILKEHTANSHIVWQVVNNKFLTNSLLAISNEYEF